MVALTVCGALIAPAPAAATTGAAPAIRLVDIPARDGVILKADVVTPAAGTPGTDAHGRYPLVVQPASWGQDDLEYLAENRRLAAEGYVVVTYTVRGFWLSGGRVDVAGPADVSDISSVIDWSLARTPADPRRVGMIGLSLGAGLTLMGAAFDPRVKAVAALSGWGDLTDSLYSGQTRHLQAAAALTALQSLTGRAGGELRRTLADLFTNRDTATVLNWARTRSPATYADRVNDHGTAVFLAGAWGDSIFNPSQLTAFYQRLTVPKRLELRPGDHATQELTGLLGLDNETWAHAAQWLDRHLKSGDHGGGESVELRVRPDGREETYPDWASISSHTERLPLGRPDRWGTGALGDGASAGWQTRIVGGLDSGADGGITELSGLLDQVAKLPPVVEVPLLPRIAAAVWESERFPDGRHIRGSAHLHTTVTAAAPDGTAFAYLYDVDAWGRGKLITHAPQSWIGRPAGHPFPLDVSMYATGYDLPPGHRLALVLDSSDPLYAGRTPLASAVTFGSPAVDPSTLTVPLR